MTYLLAHIGHDESGLIAGFLHPILGADHLLAAIAVGILATCLAGEPSRRFAGEKRRASTLARLAGFPLAFIGGMSLGGMMARLGIPLPGIEIGIALSLIVVGAALMLRKFGSMRAAMAVLAVLALFHGHAHLAEFDAAHGLTGYALGLIAATALLHAAGIALSTTMERFKLPPSAFARAAGMASLAFGVLKVATVV